MTNKLDSDGKVTQRELRGMNDKTPIHGHIIRVRERSRKMVTERGAGYGKNGGNKAQESEEWRKIGEDLKAQKGCRSIK